jgi:hypothetical protein
MLHVNVLTHPLHAILLGAFAVVDVVFVLLGIHDSEEGLARFQRAPILRVVIVDGAFVDEVEIELAGADTFAVGGFDVGREKARVAQTLRHQPHACRKAKVIATMRPYRVRVRRGLIQKAERLGAQAGFVENTRV